MNPADFPNWRLRHKVIFIIACWAIYGVYYFARNQFGIPAMHPRELLGSLPIFVLTAHGTFFFLNRFFAEGRIIVGALGLAVWHTAVFFLAYVIVNLLNAHLPEPFLDGQTIPIGNPFFLNLIVTALVNFSVVGLVFFLVYRTVSYANAKRMEAEGRLAAMQKQAEAEAGRKQYEYSALAGQVSPHFVINVLLSWEARIGKGNKREAAAMHWMYGLQLYHIRARERGNEVVPLQEEIDQMMSFLSLIEDTTSPLFIATEIDGNTAGYTIPPTTLIAFVDNAYKHGVVDDPDNPIRITLRIRNQEVRFSCHNRIAERSERTSHGVGLANARRRLDIQYEDSHNLATCEQNGDYLLELVIRF